MSSNDFSKQDIYILAKDLYALIIKITKEGISFYLKDQIERASISILLNFAEGYGRYHKRDKKQFYIMSRASLNEVIACYDLIKLTKNPKQEDNEKFEQLSLRLSKMLAGLINVFKD
jgi:four helix bundle protein